MLDRPEPVLKWAAVVGLVNALVLMLNEFGYISVTSDQIGALGAFMVALGGVVVPIAIMYIPRSMVTPLSDPKDNEGRKLTADG